MSRHEGSLWARPKAANDNERDDATGRGNRTQPRAVICDLPDSPGIIQGEADLLARFFHQIANEVEPANDNEAPAED